MPRDFNSMIASLVSSEVERLLAPYRNILERFSSFVGAAPARRGPGRPRKNAAKATRRGRPARAARRARRGSKGKSLTRLAKKFSAGQAVKYRQGTGTFDAKVVAIDTASGMVTVARIKDGKKVRRPATKVIVA